jgi:hypothetical protein
MIKEEACYSVSNLPTLSGKKKTEMGTFKVSTTQAAFKEEKTERKKGNKKKMSRKMG